MIEHINLKKELAKIGFRKDFYIAVCQNRFLDKKSGETKKCAWESNPATSIFLSSQLRRGSLMCPFCMARGTPITGNGNIKIVKYTPFFIALKCPGKSIGTTRHVDGNAIVKKERCDHFMGVEWLHAFKEKLRKRTLKCPQCGNNSHFVRTWREKSQLDLMNYMINNDRLPILKALLDDNVCAKKEIKKYFGITEEKAKEVK